MNNCYCGICPVMFVCPFEGKAENCVMTPYIKAFEGINENPPLSLEQLKQMQGEPVWCVVSDCPWIPKDGYWVLTDENNIIPPSLVPMSFEFALSHGWILLRHKPVKEK